MEGVVIDLTCDVGCVKIDEDKYKCPISADYMRDPVEAGDGYVYEHAMIREWILLAGDNDVKSPRTNLPMPKTLHRSFYFYQEYKEWCLRTGRTPPDVATTFGAIAIAPHRIPDPGHLQHQQPPHDLYYCHLRGTTIVLRSNFPGVKTILEEDNGDGDDELFYVRLDILSLPQLKNLVRLNTGCSCSGMRKSDIAAFLTFLIRAHDLCGDNDIRQNERLRHIIPLGVTNWAMGKDACTITLDPWGNTNLTLYCPDAFISGLCKTLDVRLALGTMTVFSLRQMATWNDINTENATTRKQDLVDCVFSHIFRHIGGNHLPAS